MSSEYDFAAKRMHRAGLVALQQQTPTLPLMYLDGAKGEATHEFIHMWRLPPDMLAPVNHDPAVVESIRTNHPGVNAKAGNIDELLVQEPDDSYAAVWLDYTCRFCPTVHVECFKQALRVGSYVSVTFCTRAVDKEILTRTILRKVKMMSRVIENVTPYKGRSDVENMLKFTLARKDTRPEVEDEEVDGSEEEVVDEFREGMKVFVDYRGVDLTAIVLNTRVDDEKVLVRFDCDAEERWVAYSKVMRNDASINMTPFVGTDIGVPVKLFRDGLCGYETTKRSKKKLFFRVTKPHRCSGRFTLNAIRKDGSIDKKPEKWTVTPEQVACWYTTK